MTTVLEPSVDYVIHDVVEQIESGQQNPVTTTMQQLIETVNELEAMRVRILESWKPAPLCTQEEVETYVSNGILFLDERHPNWLRCINLNVLDVMHTTKCVLGQLYGNYHIGVKRYTIHGNQAFELGFAVRSIGLDLIDVQMRYNQLTAEWKRQIIQRRLQHS